MWIKIGALALAGGGLAFLGLVALAWATLECPDCGGDGDYPHPCSTCGELWKPRT